MSIRIGREPFSFVGGCIATYITHADLAYKITTLVRAIFIGGLIFSMKYPFAIPLATILPVSIGASLFTLFAETVIWGYVYSRD